MLTQLHLIVDPMCSWCWGFRSSWQTFLAELPPSVIVKDLMGGLAPDSHEPMDAQTQAYVQNAWRAVAERTGANFNYQFWDVCEPRRSTYPACRAVISAGLQSTSARARYFEAVQQAYYLEARDPSHTATLIALAGEIGLDSTQFEKDLDSSTVQEAFGEELAQVRALGVTGFPTVFWHQQDAIGGDRSGLLSAGFVDVNTLRENWLRLTN
ncbi:MAG: DsbA family protein [Pseudomonadota bacterium]|nr:DsbA family protein [Pseudomonadota bacterium]